MIFSNKLPHRISAGILFLGLILVITLLTPTSLFNHTPSVTIAAEPVKGIAENVIYVVIDGLRNQEAFDDPTHQYIPHIWNDLKPQGLINTNFWNTGWTLTTPAHNTIVTGVRAKLANQNIHSSEMRAKYPNIFEYYRKQKNIPKEKVWVIAGKGVILESLYHSLNPDYSEFSASSESLDMADADTWDSVQQKMSYYHPSLILINYRDVDHSGHQGVWSGYVDSIIKADQIVFDMWQKIQNDSYYKDKTDLIITTDHGRDCDGFHQGFENHGHRDRCNRHIMFLALGPDFKQNQVVNTWRQQVDVAPTIGAILGFQTPYADGEVMTELFNDSNIGSNIITGGQRRISLSASASGLHAVWSQKSGEEWDIYYKKSQDGGSTWTQPIKLFENGLNNNYYYEAEITSQDNGLVYAAAVGYSSINEGGDTYTWQLFGRRSLDGGNTWEPVQALRDAKTLAMDPAIASRGEKILITYSKLISLKSVYSADKGTTFRGWPITDIVRSQSPLHSTITADKNRFYVAWTNERANPTHRPWNVYFDRSTSDPKKPSKITWGTDKPIASNTKSETRFFMNNSIAINNSGLIKLLITSREDTTDVNGNIIAGKWKTAMKTSSDHGNTFATAAAFYDSATYEAWNPRVSFMDPATQDFMVLWEQHNNKNGAEIYGRKKLSSGWQSIFPISSSDGYESAEPDLAIYHNDAYAGWQDYETGNWQIKVLKIN